MGIYGSMVLGKARVMVRDVDGRRGSREVVRDHRPLGWPGVTRACSVKKGQARVQGNVLEGPEAENRAALAGRGIRGGPGL